MERPKIYHVTRDTIDVYYYIWDYYYENGYCPVLRQIRDHFNYKSASTPQHFVDCLYKEGLLLKRSGKWGMAKPVHPNELNAETH